MENVSSEVSIDVVIPALDKDYDVLLCVIASIRKNIRHPIGKIWVVSPESKIIKNLCRVNQCNFIDENTVLPITKKDIHYSVNGLDRSGWLFQQLLKWGSDVFVESEYFLVTDSDTVFCRPRVFIRDNKILFSVSSRIAHIPYFIAYRKLLGEDLHPLMSFVSHHSLIKKSILTDLKREIEKKNAVEWYRAIINNIDIREASSFSEYETYGQYTLSNYPNEYLLEHWFNLSLQRRELKNLALLIRKFSSKYKTLSFHSYT